MKPNFAAVCTLSSLQLLQASVSAAKFGSVTAGCVHVFRPKNPYPTRSADQSSHGHEPPGRDL